jgi:predicted GH43/DUF377 family glycosyl hydrolase
MKYSRFLTVLVLLPVSILLLNRCGKSKENTDTDEWALLPFVKADDANPVLEAGTNKFICPVLNQEVKWDEKDVFNPAVVVRDNKVHMIFRAEDTIGKYAGTSRLGLAVSDDGLHFTKRAEPVFFPDNDSMKVYEWEGGVEDPRIVEDDSGRYYMTYTAYDGNLARLCIATSTDLITWTKHGLVLKGKYKDTWSKSGAIAAERVGDRMVAKKIDGQYWMYYGDTYIFIATSTNLIDWKIIEADTGGLRAVLGPRPGMFDSRLVEPGPYALVTDKGVLLLYNGMNLDEGGDPDIAKGAYSSGQALFSLEDPSILIRHLKEPFLVPDKPYEITGQINQVVFIEGMVPFKGKWYLYYGTADSKIAAAIGPDVK